MLGGADVEQDLGAVAVGRAGDGRGRRAVTRSPSATRMRSSRRPGGDSADRAAARDASAVPRADERPGRRVDATAGDGAGVGARRGGDGGVGDERGRGRGGDPRRRHVASAFPAATCACGWTRTGVPHRPGGTPRVTGSGHDGEVRHHPLRGARGRGSSPSPGRSSANRTRPLAPIDPVLAQRVVQATFRSVDSLRRPTISAHARWYVPAGNSFGRVPGTTTERGGT